MYADAITPSMRRAIDETERRRTKQDAFNKAHGIVPKTVKKSVRELLEISKSADLSRGPEDVQLTKQQRLERIAKLEKEMKEAAKMLEFELGGGLERSDHPATGREKEMSRLCPVQQGRAGWRVKSEQSGDLRRADSLRPSRDEQGPPHNAAVWGGGEDAGV